MRRLITLFFLVFTLSGVAFAQQMSDDQVVQYVKSAQQMGKNQKQITTELMRRGVTKEQVERIQKKYENSKSGSPTKARPIPKRCFIPSEKCFVFFFPTSSRPIILNISSI